MLTQSRKVDRNGRPDDLATGDHLILQQCKNPCGCKTLSRKDCLMSPTTPKARVSQGPQFPDKQIRNLLLGLGKQLIR